MHHNTIIRTSPYTLVTVIDPIVYQLNLILYRIEFLI